MKKINFGFKPSEELIDLILKNVKEPDDETKAFFKGLFGEVPIEKQKKNIDHLINGAIFSFFTQTAKQAVRTKKPIELNHEKQQGFNIQAEEELLHRLGQDRKKDNRKTVNLLYQELCLFFETPRKFVWGDVFTDGSGIKMELNNNAAIIYEEINWSHVLKD